jgi:hypothetical protein
VIPDRSASPRHDQEQRMAIEIITEVWKHSKASGSDLLVLLAIADNANETTRTGFPGIKLLAQKSRISERNVQYCIATLKDLGELEVIPNYNEAGRQTSNIYRVTDPATWGGAKIAPSPLHPQGEPSATGGVQPEPPGGVQPVAPHINRHIEPSVEPSDLTSTAGQAPTEKNGSHQGKEGFKLEPEEPTLNQQTWEAYKTAYLHRYRTDPVRNVRTNAQIAQLTKRLGKEAPAVAAFYLTHNSGFYVSKCHQVGNLLADAEKLRTEWATNTRVTTTKAQQADKSQTNMDLKAQVRARLENSQ